MRNWIRTAVIGTVMAWCGTSLLAFTSSDIPVPARVDMGLCKILFDFSTTANEETAFVGVEPILSRSGGDDRDENGYSFTQTWWIGLPKVGSNLKRYVAEGQYWRRGSNTFQKQHERDTFTEVKGASERGSGSAER